MRQRDIFIFWLPLFASWLLMTSEGPLITAAVNRLPEAVVMLAAVGIVLSLSVALESPIINLLSTATALVADRPTYLLVRRFTVHWMLLLTAVSAAIAFVAPFFDATVRGLLGVPPEIAVWVRPGMQIMVLWSAAIAWRRFLQGVLIHFGATRQVGWGTGVRLLFSGGSAIGLALWGGWPGVVLGAVALMAGVVAEAIYATLAARPLLRRLPELAADGGEPLTYRGLVAFHMPLAATSVLTLLVQPLVTSSLARLDQPTLTLAAWPLVFHATLWMRSAAMALPEAVIALARDDASRGPIGRFSIALAAASLAAMALFTVTPLVDLYVFDLQDAPADVGAMARLGLLLFLPLPALATLISWRRGLLIGRRRTVQVNQAMMLRLVMTATGLALGVLLGWPGIVTAAAAINAAVAAELVLLLLRG